MKIAVMQPYLFPYIGYWQLIEAVDQFVILDDVHYINGGWINRNRLGSSNGPVWMTMPLLGASQNRLISEIEVVPDDRWKIKLRKSMVQLYSKQPYFETSMPIVDHWLGIARGKLSPILRTTIQSVCDHLGIGTEILCASQRFARKELKGQDRILDICQAVGASEYVNAPGGRDVYNAEKFGEHDVQLSFIQPSVDGTKLTLSRDNGAMLSIVDLMMRNSLSILKEAVQTEYALVVDVR